jgi:hypothetical protein
LQIDRDLAQHWSEIEIQNEDIALVAEEDSLIGFVAVWCRPTPFIDNLHVRPSHNMRESIDVCSPNNTEALNSDGYSNAGFQIVAI